VVFPVTAKRGAYFATYRGMSVGPEAALESIAVPAGGLTNGLLPTTVRAARLTGSPLMCTGFPYIMAECPASNGIQLRRLAPVAAAHPTGTAKLLSAHE
jgi:hypothetical protein